MTSKSKLPAGIPQVMLDDGLDDQALLDRLDKEERRSGEPERQEKIPDIKAGVEPKIGTKKKYRSPKIPKLLDENNPTLHSEYLKAPKLSDKQEVLLAIMDAQIEEVKEGEEEIPKLREKWVESAADILTGAPPTLPPLREINHNIPLKDDTARYHHHLPKCPDSLKNQLSDKIKLYTEAGWWEETNVPQAAPMICIPKKNGNLRTVIDCRKRNLNTEKDVTPFPDQEQIRHDVSRGKHRSKIDMSNAYEQIRVNPKDVWKTSFATVYGTFVSHTMQQGDCNAPATFQRLMTAIFREYIGRFVHVYLDDIFIFSDSVEEHEKHLALVFDKLRKAQLYLEESKLDLYSKRMDCLGHIIDDRGIHADADKMARVREWRTPRNKHDIQRFLGLVQYLAHFMPDVSAYTGPLSAIQRNGQPFLWKPMHQICVDRIKDLACRTPILRPIDPRKDEPIWVICDASASGVGAVYGQGPTWQECRPAGFMSKKFTAAQHNYRVFEMETIAILEALLKWEDKLVGNTINVVTDHRALEFFKTQRRLSSRQMRWMEFLERFDYKIQYVKGVSNKVADSLSRYYQSDTDDDNHPTHDYVNADSRLDPEGEDLPWNRVIEVRAMNDQPHRRQLSEVMEERQAVANEFAKAINSSNNPGGRRQLVETSDVVVEELPNSPTGEPKIREEYRAERSGENPTIYESISEGPELRKYVEKAQDFIDKVKAGYKRDPLFTKIIDNPSQYRTFRYRDGLLYTTNRGTDEVLCIPRYVTKDYSVTGIVIEQAHRILGHYSAQKTSDYIRRWYWWPRLGPEVEEFCKTCGICQATKTSTKRPLGLLHSLPIPTRPWGSIGMDFVGPFPRSKAFDYLWVVICRLTSMVHVIPVKTTTTATELAYLYVKEIVRLHGLSDTIVSDRDSKFTSRFWQEVHRILGTKLLMSTAFHPQTDGATERANKSIGQILRTMVNPDQTDWVDKIPLVEFAINSNISSSTGFAPFELNYGFMPTLIGGILPTEDAKPGVKKFVNQALENLTQAHDAIIESRVMQTHYANRKRRGEDLIQEGDKLYLSTENLALPKRRARKLMPKYIGPYEVTKSRPHESRYTLDLPPELKARRIHPTFHITRLRPYYKNDDAVFPKRDAQAYYDFGNSEDNEWLVEDINAHNWRGSEVEFLVQWNLGDTTWEPYSECKDLAALDRYLELLGIDSWKMLPRKSAATREKAKDAPRQESRADEGLRRSTRPPKASEKRRAQEAE